MSTATLPKPDPCTAATFAPQVLATQLERKIREVYGSPQDAALLHALFQCLRLGDEQRRDLFSAAMEFECLASWIEDRFPGEGRARKYLKFAESLRDIEACANGGQR